MYSLGVFIAAYILDDIYMFCRKRWAIFSNFWMRFSIFNSVLLSIGFTMMAVSFYIRKENDEDDNRAALSGNDIVNVGSALFCIGVTLQLLRPLRWFLFFSHIGPVIVSIVRCLYDFFTITLVFIIILNAFAIGSFSLFKTFDLERQTNSSSRYTMHQQDLVKLKGLVGGFFWRLFDPGSPEYASITKCNPSDKDAESPENCEYVGEKEDLDINDLSVEFSHLMGIFLWAAYQMVTVIILINILIAMMTSTYQRIINDSDRQWKYSKSFYQLDFLRPSSIMPPPFKYSYFSFCHKSDSRITDSCPANTD